MHVFTTILLLAASALSQELGFSSGPNVVSGANGIDSTNVNGGWQSDSSMFASSPGGSDSIDSVAGSSFTNINSNGGAFDNLLNNPADFALDGNSGWTANGDENALGAVENNIPDAFPVGSGFIYKRGGDVAFITNHQIDSPAFVPGPLFVRSNMLNAQLLANSRVANPFPFFPNGLGATNIGSNVFHRRDLVRPVNPNLFNVDFFGFDTLRPEAAPSRYGYAAARPVVEKPAYGYAPRVVEEPVVVEKEVVEPVVAEEVIVEKPSYGYAPRVAPKPSYGYAPHVLAEPVVEEVVEPVVEEIVAPVVKEAKQSASIVQNKIN